MRDPFFKYIIFILVSTTIFSLGAYLYEDFQVDKMRFEYIEDAESKMGIEEVMEHFTTGDVLVNEGAKFTFGNSTSTYWIRIPLGEMSPQIYKEYISIYNSTVEKAVLYMPFSENRKTIYKTFCSGWGFGENTQDKGFLYPVFSWSKDTDFSKDAYIKLNSDFIQNYRIDFLTEIEWNRTMGKSFFSRGIFFGILIALAFCSLISYISMKHKVLLYYFFFIFVVIIYQGCLLGIYNVFTPTHVKWIMSNTIVLSIISLSALLFFTGEFFKTKAIFPNYNRILKGLVLLNLVDVIFNVAKQYHVANLYSHIIANIDVLFIILIAIQVYKKGVEEAKLFILSWIPMAISLGIRLFRYIGCIPSNPLIVNIIYIATILQAVILFIAVLKMISVLAKEKEIALKQFKAAEEDAESHKIAFLHAQIKPHFLYNAINVIVSLCRTDAEKAKDLLLDLSDFLRHNFDFYEYQKLVSLQEEMEYIQAYVRIEKARFRNKLEVCYELMGVNEPQIPPLMLQPLIENAINHGIRKRSGTGTITLRVIEAEDNFIIEVEDDGVGMTKEQIDHVFSEEWYKGKGVGVVNIHKRLERIYGKGLEIKSTPGEGTVVSFLIAKGS